ncbi:MAG: hypothetical protein OHK0017_07470 [Patescibacteria group bacterium]
MPEQILLPQTLEKAYQSIRLTEGVGSLDILGLLNLILSSDTLKEYSDSYKSHIRKNIFKELRQLHPKDLLYEDAITLILNRDQFFSTSYIATLGNPNFQQLKARAAGILAPFKTRSLIPESSQFDLSHFRAYPKDKIAGIQKIILEEIEKNSSNSQDIRFVFVDDKLAMIEGMFDMFKELSEQNQALKIAGNFYHIDRRQSGLLGKLKYAEQAKPIRVINSLEEIIKDRKKEDPSNLIHWVLISDFDDTCFRTTKSRTEIFQSVEQSLKAVI